jgi:hypothetical protein
MKIFVWEQSRDINQKDINQTGIMEEDINQKDINQQNSMMDINQQNSMMDINQRGYQSKRTSTSQVINHINISSKGNSTFPYFCLKQVPRCC